MKNKPSLSVLGVVLLLAGQCRPGGGLCGRAWAQPASGPGMEALLREGDETRHALEAFVRLRRENADLEARDTQSAILVYQKFFETQAYRYPEVGIAMASIIARLYWLDLHQQAKALQIYDWALARYAKEPGLQRLVDERKQVASGLTYLRPVVLPDWKPFQTATALKRLEMPTAAAAGISLSVPRVAVNDVVPEAGQNTVARVDMGGRSIVRAGAPVALLVKIVAPVFPWDSSQWGRGSSRIALNQVLPSVEPMGHATVRTEVSGRSGAPLEKATVATLPGQTGIGSELSHASVAAVPAEAFPMQTVIVGAGTRVEFASHDVGTVPRVAIPAPVVTQQQVPVCVAPATAANGITSDLTKASVDSSMLDAGRSSIARISVGGRAPVSASIADVIAPIIGADHSVTPTIPQVSMVAIAPGFGAAAPGRVNVPIGPVTSRDLPDQVQAGSTFKNTSPDLGNVNSSVVRVALVLGQIDAGRIAAEDALAQDQVSVPEMLEELPVSARDATWTQVAELLLKRADDGTTMAQMLKSPVAARMRVARIWAFHLRDPHCAALYESVMYEPPDKTDSAATTIHNSVVHGRRSNQFGNACQLLGEYYQASGQPARANELFQQVLEYEPEQSYLAGNAALSMARDYTQLGQPEKAREMYEQVAAHGYGWATGAAICDQAAEFIREGRYQEARETLREPVFGLYADQIRVAILSLMASSYYEAGEFGPASRYSQQSIDSYATLKSPLQGENLEAWVKVAHDILENIDRWRREPFVCEPKQLYVVASPGETSLRQWIKLRTYPGMPMKLKPDDARLRAGIEDMAGSGKGEARDGDIYVYVEVKTEEHDTSFKANLEMSWASDPSVRVTIPVQVYATSAG